MLRAAVVFTLLVPTSSAAQPVPATSGRIVVVVLQNGNPASGTFTVYRVDPSSGRAAEEVAMGQTGNAASVPPGTYDVVVRLDGAVERPERWMRGVRVSGGQTVHVRRSFETAGLGVRVKIPGAAGMLRADVGHGLRDRATAFTIGWQYEP
jgi:hypothetical protein